MKKTKPENEHKKLSQISGNDNANINFKRFYFHARHFFPVIVAVVGFPFPVSWNAAAISPIFRMVIPFSLLFSFSIAAYPNESVMLNAPRNRIYCVYLLLVR